MNIRIPSLVLFLLICALPLRAEDPVVGGVVTNSVPSGALEFTSQVNQVTSAPVQVVKVSPGPTVATNFPEQTAKAATAILSEPEKSSPAANLNAPAAGVEMPRDTSRAREDLMWLGLIGASVISSIAIVFTWRTSRRDPPTASLPARVETSAAVLAPNLLPVISQAIKEALVQELAAQRRELLSAQQSAAAELAGLARRLEAIQTPLLERLGGVRSPGLAGAKFHREIPVNIYCACGQKFSFDIQPVDGRMPFPVACQACGQDGTHQANQIIARLLNGLTQPPAPGGPALLNSAPAAMTPEFVEAVKQAVVKELAAAPAEPSKTIPMAVVRKSQNGSAMVENHAGNFVTDLLTEGQSLADAGELDKAAKCFEAALVLQPDRAEALVKMGSVLDKLDRADEALQHYDRAIALDESLTIAYLNKGGLFNRLARYDEALRCYEQALHKQKKSAA